MADKTIGALTPAAAWLTTDLLEKQPVGGPPSERGATSQLITLLNSLYAPITGGAYVLKAGDTMTGLLQFSGTGHFGLRLNNLTTAQRDAIGVGSAGMAIWNTTTSRFDMNIGGSWKNFVRLDGDTMSGMLTTDAVKTYGGTGILIGSDGLPVPAAGFRLQSFADGNVRLANFAGTGIGLIQLGGLAATEPAIKVAGTVIQSRLANDSAFGTFQGILKTSVNATATAPPVTTHTVPITDAAGVVYRCPCLV